MKNPTPLVILGIPFHNVTFAETIEWSLERIRSRRPGYIATANIDFLMQAWRDPELQRILIDADLVIADGMPIVALSKFFGPRLKERVTGSDLVPLIAKDLAQHGMSIFGLGSAPGVAQRAAEILREGNPGLVIAGTYSPPKADILAMNNSEILHLIDGADPDMLLVAFGAPKQEKWINMHFHKWRVPVAIGIGGTLDFIAGAQKRAPKFFQFLGLEWLWRMMSNPRRLVKRYLANMLFLLRAVTETVLIRCTVSAKVENILEPDETTLIKLNAAVLPAQTVLKSGKDEVVSGNAVDTARRQSIVVDLRSTGWLDSAELGLMLRLSRTCMQNGNRLYLINASKRLRHFLKMTRLNEYLRFVDNQTVLEAELQVEMKSRAAALRILSDDGMPQILLPREINAANTDELRIQFKAFWNESGVGKAPTALLADASQLDFIDSTGLGLLIEINEAACARGLNMSWNGFHGKALQTIQISRLDRVLTAK